MPGQPMMPVPVSTNPLTAGGGPRPAGANLPAAQPQAPQPGMGAGATTADAQAALAQRQPPQAAPQAAPQMQPPGMAQQPMQQPQGQPQAPGWQPGPQGSPLYMPGQGPVSSQVPKLAGLDHTAPADSLGIDLQPLEAGYHSQGLLGVGKAADAKYGGLAGSEGAEIVGTGAQKAAGQRQGGEGAYEQAYGLGVGSGVDAGRTRPHSGLLTPEITYSAIGNSAQHTAKEAKLTGHPTTGSTRQSAAGEGGMQMTLANWSDQGEEAWESVTHSTPRSQGLLGTTSFGKTTMTPEKKTEKDAADFLGGSTIAPGTKLTPFGSALSPAQNAAKAQFGNPNSPGFATPPAQLSPGVQSLANPARTVPRPRPSATQGMAKISEFALAFLNQCRDRGLNDVQTMVAAEVASMMSEKIAMELEPLVEKQAFGEGLIPKVLGWAGKARGAMPAVRSALKTDVAPFAQRATSWAGQTASHMPGASAVGQAAQAAKPVMGGAAGFGSKALPYLTRPGVGAATGYGIGTLGDVGAGMMGYDTDGQLANFGAAVGGGAGFMRTPMGAKMTAPFMSNMGQRAVRTMAGQARPGTWGKTLDRAAIGTGLAAGGVNVAHQALESHTRKIMQPLAEQFGINPVGPDGQPLSTEAMGQQLGERFGQLPAVMQQQFEQHMDQKLAPLAQQLGVPPDQVIPKIGEMLAQKSSMDNMFAPIMKFFTDIGPIGQIMMAGGVISLLAGGMGGSGMGMGAGLGLMAGGAMMGTDFGKGLLGHAQNALGMGQQQQPNPAMQRPGPPIQMQPSVHPDAGARAGIPDTGMPDQASMLPAVGPGAEMDSANELATSMGQGDLGMEPKLASAGDGHGKTIYSCGHTSQCRCPSFIHKQAVHHVAEPCYTCKEEKQAHINPLFAGGELEIVAGQNLIITPITEPLSYKKFAAQLDAAGIQIKRADEGTGTGMNAMQYALPPAIGAAIGGGYGAFTAPKDQMLRRTLIGLLGGAGAGAGMSAANAVFEQPFGKHLGSNSWAETGLTLGGGAMGLHGGLLAGRGAADAVGLEDEDEHKDLSNIDPADMIRRKRLPGPFAHFLGQD